jgi:hypothetical protein
MLKLEYVGQHWPFSGPLAYLTRPDRSEQACISVDSVGETWVEILRIPEGRYFYSERVESYRALNGAAVARLELVERGFTEVRWAQGNATERAGFGF